MIYDTNETAETLNEMIEIIKAENPTLQTGNDDDGYTELSKADYDKTILDWAIARFAKVNKIKETENSKLAAETKLAELGLSADDFKALGLA